MSDDVTAKLRNKFFNVLLEFIDDMRRVLPPDPDLEVIRNAVAFFKTKNQRLFLRITREQVLHRQADSIKRRDASFILEEAKTHVAEEDASFHQLVEKLGKQWEDFSETNRETVWKYLTTLLVLAERCA